MAMQSVLCNAGPLIALGKLNRLDILARLYREGQIPQAVYDEVVTQGARRGDSDAIVAHLFLEQCAGWTIVEVPRTMLIAYEPSVVLGPGETEVLALAQSLANPLVLLDDEAARTEARRLNIRVHGTLGVLVQAYHRKLFPLDQIELLIKEIANRPDIWISGKLCDSVLASLRESKE